MISEVTISNYKGIKHCEVKDLRRVNLFIGKNDSGKSSILEAIFHTCKEFERHNFNTIMTRRTDIFTGGRELFFNYDTKLNILVVLKFGDSEIGLELKKEGDRIGLSLSVREKTTEGKSFSKKQNVSVYNLRDFSFLAGSDVAEMLLGFLKTKPDFDL